jgi:hypothetical protein
MPTAARVRGRATLVAIAGELAAASDASAGTEEGKSFGAFLKAVPPLTLAPGLVVARAFVVQPDTSPL